MSSEKIIADRDIEGWIGKETVIVHTEIRPIYFFLSVLLLSEHTGVTWAGGGQISLQYFLYLRISFWMLS
jgi:hypothetical protein